MFISFKAIKILNQLYENHKNCSSQNHASGSSQNQQQQQRRGQPLLRQFRNEYAAVDHKQFMKTGFLPPSEPINTGIENGDEVFQSNNANNYAGRGLNPFQDGFEREAYKNPELRDLPPPPGNDDLPPPPGQDDLPLPPGNDDIPPPPGQDDLPPPPGHDDLPGPPI